MSISKVTQLALTLSTALLIGCVKEFEQEPVENLQTVVFHAGWDNETKTAIQEDGRNIWWSPGDKINLFMENSKGEYKGYELTSTSTEPASTVDFIGKIGDVTVNSNYTAVSPYNEFTAVDNGVITVYLPWQQKAVEGSFDSNAFYSVAVSSDNNLHFQNICSGIKLSVAHEGIKKIIITPNSHDESLAGELKYDLQNHTTLINGISQIEITASDESGFNVGKYYYVVLPAIKLKQGIQITFHKNESFATYNYQEPVEFKRTIFKRLYNVDAGLDFNKIYGSTAYFESGSTIIPEGVDKTQIKHVEFNVKDSRTTSTLLSSINSINPTIYFELEGNTAKYYTQADVYQFYAPSAFFGWSALEEIDLSNVKLFSSCTGLFSSCKSLRSIVFNTEYRVNINDGATGMFSGCASLETINLGGFDLQGTTDMSFMFDGCSSLKSIDLSSVDLSSVENISNLFRECSSLESVIIDNNTGHVTKMNGMFFGCRNLKRIEFRNFDTSSCTDMSSMFGACSSLEQLDLSSFNTSNVVNMSSMFSHSKIKTMDLTYLDTRNVEDMSLMFAGCDIPSLDLSKFNTSKVTNMFSMFSECKSSKLDLSSFDTGNVTTMQYMFRGCKSLESLNVSSFNTGKCTMFAEMFNHCRNLKSIDISNFTIRNDAYAYMMLAECSYLQTVNMGDNTFDNATGLLYLSGRLSDLVYIRCTNTVKDKFVTQSNYYGYNSSIMHCYTYNEEMPEYVPVQNGYYRSTDFSMNGKHKILQHATAGQGVDIVLYGDGYSDRLIADGTYESVANKTMEAIFSMEPYKSYRHLFNVYLYYAVSVNEVIGRDTAFDTYLGTNGNTSITGVIDASSFDEELLSITKKPFYKLACVGFVNNDSYHGSCEMVVSNGYGDYGNGRAYAWVTANHDEEQYRTTVLHEFGHGFAKLGDEYYLGPNTYTSADDLNWMHKCGFYMNLDTTSSLEDILWSDFLKDTRYANSGLGVFEGGFAKYQYGIWRSTENSIMNDNNIEYNVPSRKAIYNRIHKLAYGESWHFDYETFVQQDLKNIPSQTKASLTKSAPYPARVNKTPFFKMKESISSDGKKTITVIMN